MKAAIFDQGGGPEVLRIREVPDSVVGSRDLLIRVQAISLEGGDLLSRRGGRAAYPEILGYAAAGEVVHIGKDIKGFAEGQKVATFNFGGSHATLRAAPAATCFQVPDGLDMGVAAAIPCGPGTAALALQLGRLKAGETVLVTGAAGGVGLAAVQLAAKAGTRVLGTGSDAATLEKLRNYGLNDAILTKGVPTGDQVHALLGGNKVDLVIDNIGGPALIDGLHVLKDGGRAVIVGVFGGFNQPIDASYLLSHRLTVIGCFLAPVMGEPETRAIIEDLFRQALHGELQVPIDAIFPFSDIAAAHRRAEERGRIGRVVVAV